MEMNKIRNGISKCLIFQCLALILVVGLSGCASHYISANKLEIIELGMDKQKLAAKIGSGIRRGSIKNKYNQTIEVWEYKVKEGISGGELGAQIGMAVVTLGMTAPIIGQGGEVNKYWLYFVDGELVRWGQAGDWENVQRQIYDINFRVKR